MLTFLTVLTLQTSPFVAKLDELAQARDVKGLEQRLADPITGRSPFGPLGGNGSYGGGRFGWHAEGLTVPRGPKLVVFATKLTNEDIGELVFREAPGEKLRPIPEANDLGVHIEHASLTIDFDLPAKTTTIESKLEFKKFGRAGDWFLFRFSPHYLVKSVIDAKGKPVDFAESGGVVALPTGEAQEFTYTVTYSGKVDLPAFAGAISNDEAMLTNDYWYPMIARLPAAFDVTVHTIPSWSVVAQGERISESVLGNVKTTQYRMDLPVTYWSLDAGHFHRVETKFPGRTIWAAAVDVPESELVDEPELYRPILDFYEKSFGKFPFSSFGAMISRLYGGGAMEAYSFATFGGSEAPGEAAHETAHTWWGGIVDNTYLKSSWNESFADFSQGLYARNVPIGNVEERRLAFVSTPDASPAYNAAPMVDSGAEIGAAASAIGYGKGAEVLQMLETEIGTSKMIESMRTWVADQPKGVPGEWEDYERAVYKVVGPSLKWFFDEWMRRPGYADFDIDNVKWADGMVTGRVAFKSLPYRIDCEVMLQDGDGKRTFNTFDTTRTGIDGGYLMSVPCPVKPSIVSVDPWRRVLRPIDHTESPASVSDWARSFSRYTDPAHADYLRGYGGEKTLRELPADWDGVFVVGHPDSIPGLRELCAQVGFTVAGSHLTYQGTTIDLNSGCAVACVELSGGKRCLIGLGKVKHGPETGSARLALTDEYGRFLRGSTDPKTQGRLTFRL